jgi:molecular chaperone DnaK
VRLSDENKVAVEYALTELRMAHQSQDIPAVQTALDNINAAWKTATEAMYSRRQGQGEAKPEGDAQGDDVQDVDYEEVK